MQEQFIYPRISVVVPTHNEEENLRHVLPCIPPIVSEVILVDGHSTDNTIAVAQQLIPDIIVVRQTERGKGNAMKLGFAASTGDIIVMIDADGSTDPCEIPRFIAALLAGNDFAKGSRFAKGGGSADISLLRHIGNFGLCTLVNVLFAAHFKDLCYGYNAFWKRCLDDVDIDCNGFEVETLLTLRMHKARKKIAEVPSFEYRRIHGQSNLRTFRDGWRVLKTIFSERREMVKPVQRSHARALVHSLGSPEQPSLHEATKNSML
jgi:glycosyltransferase involved in cell wall biosynthesis